MIRDSGLYDFLGWARRTQRSRCSEAVREAKRPFHEDALLWHRVELAHQTRRQEGSATVQPGRRERWPARQADVLVPAAIGDRPTCPHRRPGSRSFTTSPCLTAPGTPLFEQLVTAWALCPAAAPWPGPGASCRPSDVAATAPTRAGSGRVNGRRAGPGGAWSSHLVEHRAPARQLTFLLDDTLVNKSGRMVDGAASFHDAATSPAVAHQVTAGGLNVVVLALRVPFPWGGEPLALPVMARPHRKSNK